jgi:hypothetical protein
VQTENEKAVRDQFEKWYRENRFHMPTEQEDEIAWDAWQAALQSQVSNTDGAEQESLQAENARLKDELEELSDLLFNIRTLPVHGYLTKDEFIAAFRQEINTVPEVRVSKQRQEIEALRKELQAATAAPKAPQQQEQSGEAVTLDGPELWELLFGIFEGDVPRELTDDKIAAIAEAINHAGFTSPAPPTSTAIAAMVIKQAANLVRESLGGRAGDMLASEILANAEAALEALTDSAKRESNTAIDAAHTDPNVCYGDGYYDGYWKGREEGWDAAIAAQNPDDARDAARYRWLRAMATQQADSLGPIFRIDVRRSAPYLFNFGAAVDAAMQHTSDGGAA